MAECPERRKNGAKNFEMAGFRFPLSALITAESIQKFFAIRPESNDIFLSSYPKCDSNFIDLIIFNLLYPQKAPKLNDVTNRHIPCMEMTLADDYITDTLLIAVRHYYPRLFKTYLPLRLIPFYKKAKYIYVVRTPWDVCASYYRFLHQLGSIGDSFEDFFRDFLAGRVAYESIFDHVAPWMKLSGKDNVLVLSYEHVQNNPRSAIFTIAAFLGELYLKKLTSNTDFESSILRELEWDKPKKCTSDEMDPPLVKAIANAMLLKEESPGIKIKDKPVLTYEQLHFIAERVTVFFCDEGIETLWLNLFKKKLAMLAKE